MGANVTISGDVIVVEWSQARAPHTTAEVVKKTSG
jgi:hypothetical protein